MAKELDKVVKLQVRGGAANPSPPVGPAVRSGSVTWDQVKVIAEDKMVDLNAFTVESAMSMVAGTARSMGMKVSGKRPF